MPWQGWAQLALFALLVAATVRPLGGYIVRVIEGGRTPLQRVVCPAETSVYRLAGVDPSEEQTWPVYALGLLMFHLIGFLALYGLQCLQNMLPLNPQQFDTVSPDLALNTAISVITNTSWQSSGGETTLSKLVQMTGITVQSFLSAAAGISVAIALVRGFARRSVLTIGNVWVDLTRATLYILLPICVIGSLLLVRQAVPQTLPGFAHSTTLEGARQVIARGPVASQQVIAVMSGDGGGFFNANASHPFENPTALSGIVDMPLIFLIGVPLTNTSGRMVGDERQGWTLFAAMAVMFLAGAAAIYAFESTPNHAFVPFRVQASRNLEGKEVRFGVGQSSIFATVSAASSDGAVDAMHDSYMPLSGLIMLSNMMLDEVIVGDPGFVLFGMLLFAIVAVFVAGLMIGRTPGYLGKKLEGNEIKMTMLVLLTVPAIILVLTAVAAVVPAGLAGLTNNGPHGCSELLYAYTSGCLHVWMLTRLARQAMAARSQD